MDELLAIVQEIGYPNAYDHFAEGEAPELPYILYLVPESNNFAADNYAYFKVNEVHIELYTARTWRRSRKSKLCLIGTAFFITGLKRGSRANSSMKSFIISIWR